MTVDLAGLQRRVKQTRTELSRARAQVVDAAVAWRHCTTLATIDGVTLAVEVMESREADYNDAVTALEQYVQDNRPTTNREEPNAQSSTDL
jgi:MinD superfamily P-loop ATPase